jgi:hypothetical protein
MWIYLRARRGESLQWSSGYPGRQNRGRLDVFNPWDAAVLRSSRWRSCGHFLRAIHRICLVAGPDCLLAAFPPTIPADWLMVGGHRLSQYLSMPCGTACDPPQRWAFMGVFNFFHCDSAFWHLGLGILISTCSVITDERCPPG